jgi:hypothetical protein
LSGYLVLAFRLASFFFLSFRVVDIERSQMHRAGGVSHRRKRVDGCKSLKLLIHNHFLGKKTWPVSRSSLKMATLVVPPVCTLVARCTGDNAGNASLCACHTSFIFHSLTSDTCIGCLYRVTENDFASLLLQKNSRHPWNDICNLRHGQKTPQSCVRCEERAEARALPYMGGMQPSGRFISW